MSHKTLHAHLSDGHPDSETLDRWRAGLLASSDEVATHVAHCQLCQKRSRFTTDLIAVWSARPQGVTIFRQPHYPARRAPFWIGVAASACLLLAVGSWQWFSGVSSQPSAPNSSNAPVVEQQVVAHLTFYEWLNTHPNQLEQVADHG
ncbi:hypothetical protein AB4090_10265 [Acidithiobacillus sp. IBUN Pt1247-S3]|uniref:hypothetical protein n=1 Tax=Acidithiobacillus sp. IBUN Pt1247-S3 TaxID=3166642 RepID=UPI0034E5D33A